MPSATRASTQQPVSDDPGRAGRSATSGYRLELARWRRRRRSTAGWLLVVVAAGAVAGHAQGSARTAAAVVALGAVVLAWVGRPRPDPERWERGASGEEATAHLLAELPARRWVVFHDRRVPGSRANLDHVVVGPTGVWVIDTKTVRGAVRPRQLPTEALTWETGVVADRLGTDVRPVVALHASCYAGRGWRAGRVRIVPAARLLRHVRRGTWVRPRLRRADVARLAARFDDTFAPAGGR